MRAADGGASLDDAQTRAADAGVKGMIPIKRAFLDYVMSALADAGLTDICLVIGPEHGAVRNYY
ncbi:MAG: nucleotidyltransferase family protein, partial [Gemmatimonadaceae bacterium]